MDDKDKDKDRSMISMSLNENTKTNDLSNNISPDHHHKAFVVMNGNTKTITSIKNTLNHKTNNKEITITEDDKLNQENTENAIIIGECTKKLISTNDDSTNTENIENKNKNTKNESETDKNDKIKPLINNVINEASNLCLNGIVENNQDENIRVIGNNVIRNDKIQILIEKMGTVSNQKNHKIKNEHQIKINRNPVTNKFSTYYDRNEKIGGIKLKSLDIGNSYTKKQQIINNIPNNHNHQHIINDDNNSMDDDDDDNDDDDGEYDENENESQVNTENTDNNNHRFTIRTRARTRSEHQNCKKAKKYTAPSEELTRLQIREDIRKMRKPKIHELKNILKDIGFDQYINHKIYISINNKPTNKYKEHDVDVDVDVNIDIDDHEEEEEEEEEAEEAEDEDDDVQFIGYNHHNKRTMINIDNRNHHNDHNHNNLQSPPSKKQKLNVSDNDIENDKEAIKCNKCNKIFTLEVDLLLHQTNDKC